MNWKEKLVSSNIRVGDIVFYNRDGLFKNYSDDHSKYVVESIEADYITSYSGYGSDVIHKETIPMQRFKRVRDVLEK